MNAACSRALVLVCAVVGACGQATASHPADASPAPASVPATTPPIATSTTSPIVSPVPQIVGVWVGTHQCQRIMDIMTAAGMPEQGLMNIVDAGTLPGVGSVADIPDSAHPCTGAVDVKHSHFFTAAGEFGSRDSVGTRVDDGTWSLADADTILIGNEEGATPFDFVVTGTAMRLTPIEVGTCPTDPVAWCKEAWKLMVAMPGMDWQRAN